MVPMRWDILVTGLVLAGLITLVLRWVKNKIPTKNKLLKAIRTLINIAFVIWLLVVIICTARYLLDEWERAVAIHKLQPVVNWLEVGWICVLRAPERIEAAKEQLSNLPQVVVLPPLPATPIAVPAVTLEELQRRELPPIPQEIKVMTAQELVTLGWAQTTSQSKQTVVIISGVVSPTLSSDFAQSETVATKRVITEGIVEPLAPTQMVTVQIFKDGTLLVSSKNVTETVVGAGGWVQKVRQVAELADKLDVIGRLPEKDNIRVELAQAMSQMRVVLEFNGITTDPAAEYGTAFTDTERLVNKLLALSVAMGQNDTYQPPRGEETQVGTEHLQGLVMSYRNEYYLLLARHGVIADQIHLGKIKLDGRERSQLLKDAKALQSKIDKLKSQISIEMDVNGTEYKIELLQWLNLTDRDVDILVTKI